MNYFFMYKHTENLMQPLKDPGGDDADKTKRTSLHDSQTDSSAV